MRSCSPLNRRRQILATLPLAAAVSTAITATSLLAPSAAMAQLEEVVVTARATDGITSRRARDSHRVYRRADRKYGYRAG